MKKLILPLFTLALCGCPASPNVLKVKNGNEQQLSCEQLSLEIDNAKRAKIDAHEEDKFRFSNIMPTTGITSVYNIWRADAAADKRLEFLTKIYQGKGCTNQYGTQTPYNYQNNQMPNNYYPLHEPR